MGVRSARPTQWVRNLRASGEGRLLIGRRGERFAAGELDDTSKPEVFSAYLRRWRREVGTSFAGVGPDSGEEELMRIAPDHPAFRVESR